jgi:hypothetical protein
MRSYSRGGGSDLHGVVQESFQRGKQIYEDGVKALADKDLERAKSFFAQAVELFSKVWIDAKVADDLAKVQMKFNRASAVWDKETLLRGRPPRPSLRALQVISIIP